ncbi:substrate-binding domain-containing protein [Magnetococcales bacterium HHB-1]
MHRMTKFLIGLGLFLTLTHGPSVYAEVVRISGTGSALPTIEKLARLFNTLHPSFEQRFIYPAMGSGGSLKGLKNGILDLALSARPLKDKERGWGEPAISYARTPFVFAIHKDLPYTNISSEQLVGIYGLKTRQWPDGRRLRLILRPPGDSDITLIRSVSKQVSTALDSTFKSGILDFAITDLDSADRIASVPGGFGTMTLALIAAQNRPIKPLSFNGISPSIEAMETGHYPFEKTFYVIVRKGAGPQAKAFAAFLKTQQAATILTENGHLPLTGE